MDYFELFLAGVEAHSIFRSPLQSSISHPFFICLQVFVDSVAGVHPKDSEVIGKEKRFVSFVSKFSSNTSEEAVPECWSEASALEAHVAQLDCFRSCGAKCNTSFPGLQVTVEKIEKYIRQTQFRKFS